MSKSSKSSLLGYLLISRLLHHPELLRCLAKLLDRLPRRLRPAALACSATAARQVYQRTDSFSHRWYQASLVAGPFVIGREAGPFHQQERLWLQQRMPTPSACARSAVIASKRRVATLESAERVEFDLIEDYLLDVAWGGMRRMFRTAARGLEEHPSQDLPRFAHAGLTRRAFYEEMRHVGAHLIVGQAAPRQVQQRAERCASALNDRVSTQLNSLRKAWSVPSSYSDDLLQQQACGMLWVGHPATVQAGALLMQGLLQRPEVYARLWQQGRSLGNAAWSDQAWRQTLREHVLELLRFRPPFPLIRRSVPRDTAYEADDGQSVGLRAGSVFTLLSIAAMFDACALSRPNTYCPHRERDERSDSGGQHLIFGDGPRRCVAADHVTEILVSALAGLLTLPKLEWADPWWRRIAYDGPIITRMRLRPARAEAA